jgi:putative transposase
MKTFLIVLTTSLTLLVALTLSISLQPSEAEEVRQELVARSYESHISPAEKNKRAERKMEARRHLGGRARRWVVERTHSWLNRSRRLLVRWEKKTENYLAFIHLACAQLIFSKILVSG